MNNKGISVVTLVVTIIVLILVTSVTVYNGMNMVSRTRERATLDRLMTIANSIVAHEDELKYGDTVLGNSYSDYNKIDLNNTKDNPLDDILINDKNETKPLSGDVSGDPYIQLSKNDYTVMGLDKFADVENIPPTFMIKAINNEKETERVYILKSPIYVKKSAIYDESEYLYYVYTVSEKEVKDNYKMEFDEAKGVNRPLLTKDMIPVIARFSEEDFDRLNPTIVNDVYKDNWYNYNKEATMWANVMIKTSDSYTFANRYYVWIPRFAYRVHDFYKGTNYNEIPSSAIDIIFLREDTEYTAKDEVLSTGYQVHPAFRYKDETTGKEVNIPGFWVSKEYVSVVDRLYGGGSSSALGAIQISNLHPDIDSDGITSRLIKNTEWAAVAYLSMYYVGKTSDGNTLGNNASGVLNMDVETFVAAGLESDIASAIPYGDRYNVIKVKSGDESGDSASYGRMTYYSYESSKGEANVPYEYNNSERKFGDAICCTSKNDGLDEYGAWFGGISRQPTTETPFITRGLDGNMFSYSSTSNSGTTAACRNVLIIENK